MDRISGPRGSYTKSAARQREVLDAALRLVGERGFDATTLQLIADDAGMSKAGVLHHFGSRESLMLAIVRHRDEMNRRHYQGTEDGALDASFELIAHNSIVPGLVGLFAVLAAQAAADRGESERRRYFAGRYARARAGFARRFEQRRSRAAANHAIDSEVAATLLLACMDGLQLQWLHDPTIDMGAHLRVLVDALLPNDDPDSRRAGES